MKNGQHVITDLLSCKTEAWYKDDKLHREGYPAFIRSYKGKVDEWWYINNSLHREDGPAVIFGNNERHWYKNGNLHREDGPAVIYPNGVCEWYLNNVELTKEEWWEMLSDEQKLKVFFKEEDL
jgi:hypothetical protein